MSADNWTTCPRCQSRYLKEALEAKAKAERIAEEAYGKVPIEEWESLRAIALKSINEEDFDTLREDYEIYMTNTGRFAARYLGECQKCGSSFSFKHDEQVEVTP